MASSVASALSGKGALYLLGLSSNACPEKNIGLLLEALLAEFGALLLSRIHRTPPFGVVAVDDYLNAVVLVRSERLQQELKCWSRALEDQLGRDRISNDRRSVVVADLDILACCRQVDELEQLALSDEPYYLPMVAELVALVQGGSEVLPKTQTAEVLLSGRSLGAQPVALVRS